VTRNRHAVWGALTNKIDWRAMMSGKQPHQIANESNKFLYWAASWQRSATRA
jgi:hypothetical protein